ncbi:hypothetical protein EPUS_00472 [Endocarpon pusillum Z07020]|uniref:SMP-30/Gluconolactonase/LRE-like region domain-containing protein n=1 Tax=Endocarpon pusillum (strain Z07020 / HMAS-L-300199) TaxID=1263415 RepID=U1GH82_ENDPU|nr:uncharacterized protein EPUS_00472 [Endocarpon pusillum Z07020]ERF71483.1 hypothetical protein EPUS_00472 [Endocarpon pusillum Z07020]
MSFLKAFVRLLIAASFSLATAQNGSYPSNTVQIVKGVDLQLPPTAFGGGIEGAAVNAQGDVFAVDYRAAGAGPNKAFGFFSETEGGTESVLNLAANPIFNASTEGVANPPLINGARFLKDGRILIADANNSRVLSVKDARSSTFCTDAAMLQPNDLALSVNIPEMIYLSGQNFTETTIAGQHGALWTCAGSTAMQFPPALLAQADVHRTNGIETSPCGRHLYLSSATNVAGNVTANRIYRFNIHTPTGILISQTPSVFYEFTGADAAIDIDGMRADVRGNLYVTRNGDGKIVKLSPEGQLLMTINLPGMGGPSNLEFGGAEGKTLFAVGSCKANATIGCAAKFEGETVGKAFRLLQ